MSQITKKRPRKERHNMNFEVEVLQALRKYATDEGLSVCATGNSIIRKFLIANQYLAKK